MCQKLQNSKHYSLEPQNLFRNPLTKSDEGARMWPMKGPLSQQPPTDKVVDSSFIRGLLEKQVDARPSFQHAKHASTNLSQKQINESQRNCFFHWQYRTMMLIVWKQQHYRPLHYCCRRKNCKIAHNTPEKTSYKTFYFFEHCVSKIKFKMKIMKSQAQKKIKKVQKPKKSEKIYNLKFIFFF